MTHDRHDDITRKRVLDLLASGGVDEDEILAVVEAGSTAHDISVGQDDLDFTVVRLEPFSELITGPSRRQSMMLRTKPEGYKSEPGDIDLQVYTLRRFVELASGGNPAVLMILFAPAEYRPIDNEFPAETIANLTRSKRAGSAYRGYMNQQIERWTGTRGQKNVSRPDLEDAHGFDTKYAAHTVRLGIQGKEYLRTGRLTLPMRKDQAERIKALRRGEKSEQEALSWAERLLRELEEATDQSPLPDEIDSEAIDDFLVAFYANHYGIKR